MSRLSLLEQEIASQPEVIANVLTREIEHIGEIAAQLPQFDYVMIAARGSSDHAALYAKYAWGGLAQRSVALASPSLHTLYETPPSLAGALVVGVSQSGQSPDILAVMAEGRRQGRPTLAITNDGASPLAVAADHVVELHAGNERSVAATKTYTTQLAVMAAFAAVWNGEQERLAELRRLPDAMERTLKGTAAVVQRAERYRYMSDCVIIGRGYNYATAFELALKLKELTHVMALPYSSADFRHGPIATISEGSAAILIMPEGKALGDMQELAGELRERGAELLVISDVSQMLELATVALPLAAPMPEWLSPVTAILPGQVLALHLTLAKGLDPDAPRGLRKVTRTL